MPLLTPDHSSHKERLCWGRHVIQGACPCLPPITVHTKRGSVGAEVSYRGHALAYPQSQFTQREALLGQTCNTGSMPLLTPDHSSHKERLCWGRSILQRACPCIPPITVYTKRGSVGAEIFYREHALAYLQSQFTQRDALLEQTCHTGSMPLLTLITVYTKRYSVGADMPYREHALAYPDHSLHKEILCWGRSVTQGACPCLPPITAYTKRGSVGADMPYREHALAYPDHSLHKERLCWSRHAIQGACPCLPRSQFTQRETLLEQTCHTGSMPLHTLITVYTKRGSVGADMPYREHVLAYPDHSLHKERLCWGRSVTQGA